MSVGGGQESRVNQKDGGAEGRWSLRGRQRATRTPDDVSRLAVSNTSDEYKHCQLEARGEKDDGTQGSSVLDTTNTIESPLSLTSTAWLVCIRYDEYNRIAYSHLYAMASTIFSSSSLSRQPLRTSHTLQQEQERN